MPRYFFHVRDGVDIRDNEGLELESIDEVRAAAVTASGEAIRDLGRKFWAGEEWQMNVTDERGETVCTLNFSAKAKA
jgi:hypothetical protein